MFSVALLVVALASAPANPPPFERMVGPPSANDGRVSRYRLPADQTSLETVLFGGGVVSVWSSTSWTAVELRLVVAADQVGPTVDRLATAGFEVVAIAAPGPGDYRRLVARGFGAPEPLASQLRAALVASAPPGADAPPESLTPTRSGSTDAATAAPYDATRGASTSGRLVEPPWLTEWSAERETRGNGIGILRLARPGLAVAADDLPASHELRWHRDGNGQVRLAVTLALAPWEVAKAVPGLAAVGFTVGTSTARPGLGEEPATIELDAWCANAAEPQASGLAALLTRLEHRPAAVGGHGAHQHHH